MIKDQDQRDGERTGLDTAAKGNNVPVAVAAYNDVVSEIAVEAVGVDSGVGGGGVGCRRGQRRGLRGTVVIEWLCP